MVLVLLQVVFTTTLALLGLERAGLGLSLGLGIAGLGLGLEGAGLGLGLVTAGLDYKTGSSWSRERWSWSRY